MRFVVEKKNWLACGCDVAQKTTELVTNPTPRLEDAEKVYRYVVQ